MKKTIIILATLAVLGAGIGFLICDANRPGVNLKGYKAADTTEIVQNEWELHKSAGDEEALVVQWDQKYGATKTVYCKVIFYSKKTKQFKLVGKWMETVLIEASNTNDLKITKIPVDSIPEVKP